MEEKIDEENQEGELNKELNQDLNKDLNPESDGPFELEVEEEIEEIKEAEKEPFLEKKVQQKTEEEKPEKDYFKEEKKIEKLRQLVESILFMSPQPIPLKEIAGICETPDLGLISELIEALTKDLIERKSGIEIIRETEGYRMQVLSELEVKVAHLAGPTRFSKGVMKTMAYIAFKQPVKQSTVVKFRTNKAYDEIKILEEQGFISREKAGITYVIKTTKKFLQYFGEDAIKLKKNPEFELQKEE
ncbi:MAG: hypothetical protein COT90_02265 [Candidatus Diapherotrites archaeon CG10_big_fil_rev_8_21_14_0_10_31_34]|nr:MAG: hypothetical protein COT90_02265 [Candidatus Diapherotrites archaeon CG10_big_fil_rev_8_21_14_0_10_31_34]